MTDRTSIVSEGDKIIVRRWQDCESTLELAKEARAVGAVGSSEMRHAARFDNVVIEAYCNRVGITFKEWMDDPAHVKAMLSDPALRGFRIWEGRV